LPGGILQGGGRHVRSSLVAEKGQLVVGHILSSDLPISNGVGTIPALALRRWPSCRRSRGRGVGSALAWTVAGHGVVVVLGHPHFYGRFGFLFARVGRLESLSSGEALLALESLPGALKAVTGRVP
jgi:putative acetyltransferase